MDVSSSFIAHPQSPELVHPSQGAFDDPSVRAQAAAMRLPTPGQHRLDMPRTQRLPMRRRVIGPIAIHCRWPPLGSAAPTPHRRNRVQKRDPLRYIVPMGSGHRRRQRQPRRIGQQVMFAAEFTPVSRIGAGFFFRRRPPVPTHY